MTSPSLSRFVYVTYIRATPGRLWDALTTPMFIRQYWFGMTVETDWTAGSTWRLRFEDGRIADSGEIVEAVPPTRLAIRWRNEWSPELKAEGYSLCTFVLEAEGEAVKLTVTHEIERPESAFIGAVSGGWPKILSNLKSLIETGSIVLPPRA